jgi:hypothetical protein
MSIHHLKIHRKPFEDLVSGRKTSEVRNCADRHFCEGDQVELFLIDETGNPANKSIVRTITHIQTGYGLPDDICVLSYGAALAEPVPPAVGEPMPSRPYASEEDQSSMTDYEIGLGHGGCEMWDKFQPNVTRLQTEVEVLKHEVECRTSAEVNAIEHLQAAQSELTKARELFRDIANDPEMWSICSIALARRIDEQLSNQSAPADKGQGEPVAIGTLRRDANEQIVFDAVGDPHIKDGMSVFAEQPAPVAVAMPLSMHPEDFTTYPEAHCEGWNACIDEVTRLNPIKQ